MPPTAQATRTQRTVTPPLELPRGLIFLSALWLIGSWLLAIGLRTPVEPSSASYTPLVKMMLICVAIGLLVAWPLLRLSQQATRRPVGQTILDVVVLLALMQVVIWPLRLVTPWTPLRTAAIDATLSGWTILAGAVVAAAVGSFRPGPRTLAMMACVALCLLGPAAAAIAAMFDINAVELINLSPVTSIIDLTTAAGSHPSYQQWIGIAVLGGAAMAGWIGLLLIGPPSSPDVASSCPPSPR